MNNFYLDDISDAEIVKPEADNKHYKFWGLLIAFAFLMFAISGNFSFQTDEFEVTLNENEASYQAVQDKSHDAVQTSFATDEGR